MQPTDGRRMDSFTETGLTFSSSSSFKSIAAAMMAVRMRVLVLKWTLKIAKRIITSENRRHFRMIVNSFCIKIRWQFLNFQFFDWHHHKTNATLNDILPNINLYFEIFVKDKNFLFHSFHLFSFLFYLFLVVDVISLFSHLRIFTVHPARTKQIISLNNLTLSSISRINLFFNKVLRLCRK